MDTIIIGQGYNIEADSSVAKELIKLFESNRYDSFTCLVAFASYGGVSALTRYIKSGKERGMNIKVILGIDQQGTSKEALEEVLSWGVDAKIYHTDSRNIFHPKVYLFENIDIFTLIVGSNNLTVPGLVRNIECSLLIKDIKSNSIHKEFYEYWKSILDGTEANLYSLTQALIDQLYADKLILAESQRVVLYDNAEDKSGKDASKSMFKRPKMQALPRGFVPGRHIKARKRVESDSLHDTESIVEQITFNLGEEVLIAEIGGGPRWKQVNFPVDIYENFFGATRGDNSYSIKLTNIAKDSTLGEPEIRQAVSVKSRNYRFEIKCAETSGTYPGEQDRPIGIFVKLDSNDFVYQVLLKADKRYNDIKTYLYNESKNKGKELKRAIVHIEAIHAIYPELVL